MCRGDVHVVDDDPLQRRSVERVLRAAGYRVQLYEGGEDFLSRYQGAPGCLLLDLAMPGLSGEQLLTEIRRREFRLAVILLTGFATIDVAVRVTKVGVCEVLEKPADAALLTVHVDKALRDAAPLFAQQALRADYLARLETLTAREREVFELIVAGLTSVRIAEVLGRTKKTIDTHRASVMAKMAAESAVELASEWLMFGKGSSPRPRGSR